MTRNSEKTVLPADAVYTPWRPAGGGRRARRRALLAGRAVGPPGGAGAAAADHRVIARVSVRPAATPSPAGAFVKCSEFQGPAVRRCQVSNRPAKPDA
ncbi:hypothetical protein EVAR_18024_1 [Eumeta japonica]|uniref:Uncharacterized protein n=1 Tax=Eumeta variegata TaxID=151549 RepID=A0A4C1ZRP9_EUMVA|nr:hypothetical protein EVAR_18024_1 [Eumeta japonica]